MGPRPKPQPQLDDRPVLAHADAEGSDELLDVDVEGHLHWLETGEGDPWPTRDSSA